MAKVIGLDPAGPGFDSNDPSTRLNSDSADYVECIHTGYYLGIRAPICQASFFVNKGSHQQGCTNFLGIDDVACSHIRAVLYYTEALGNQEGFFGKSCSDMKSVLSGSCNDEHGEFMGRVTNEDKKVAGIFAVTTNKQAPFGGSRN